MPLWPQPRCLKDVQAFVGLACYYRRFVLNFANITEPPTRMTKKNTQFEWTARQTKPFGAKDCLDGGLHACFSTPERPLYRVWLYWPRPPLRQQHRKLQRLWTGPGELCR